MSNRHHVGASAKKITETARHVARLKTGPPGTVLFAMYASVGEVAMTEMEAVWNQALIGLVPESEKMDPRFLQYALYAVKPYLPALYRSNTQNNLNADQVLNLEIPRPSFGEQQHVADYLDREIAEIDTFIRDSWELIRLTKEHQDAELDSIVWENGSPSVKLKYLADLITGFPFKSDSFRSPNDEFKPLIRGINVAPGRIDWAETVAIASNEANKYALYVLEEGDLVLGMDRPFIREGLRIAPITRKDQGALLVQRVARLRAYPQVTSSEWLYRALRGSLFKAHLEPTFTGVSVPHISPGQIGDFPVPLPSLTEQEARLQTLLQNEKATRTVLADAGLAIDLALERHTALISAAVTGQIDVTRQRKPVAEELEDEVGVRV